MSGDATSDAILAALGAQDVDGALDAARVMFRAQKNCEMSLQDTRAILLLVDTLAETHRHEKAVAVCRYAMDFAPTKGHAEALTRRIQSWSDFARREAHMSSIAAAATAEEVLRASKFHTSREEFELAVAAAARAVALEDSMYTRNALAAAYRRAGSLADAEAEYRSSLARWEPRANTAGAVGLAAVLADGESRLREALDLCDAALAARPDSGHAHNCRGRVLVLVGREADAEDAFESALRCGGRQVSARRQVEDLIERYETRGDSDGAQRVRAILLAAGR